VLQMKPVALDIELAAHLANRRQTTDYFLSGSLASAG